MRRWSNWLRFQAWKLRDALWDQLRGKAHRQAAFQRIYDQNLWNDPDSVSGVGSGLAATETIRSQLPELFRQYGIRSVLDAPCGDFWWMKEIVESVEKYMGVDIVQDLIDRNTASYGAESRAFLCADISVDPLPQAELVLCRDCFIHLPTRMIRGALRNFKNTGAQYLLLTNVPAGGAYYDIPIGSFRPIDFTRPPFSFPEPVLTLCEDETGSRQLCLWKIQSLP